MMHQQKKSLILKFLIKNKYKIDYLQTHKID